METDVLKRLMGEDSGGIIGPEGQTGLQVSDIVECVPRL